MLFFIIIGLAIALWLSRDHIKGWSEPWPFYVMIGGLLGFFVGTALVFAPASFLVDTTVHERAPLRVLQDGSGLKGNFFIGTGTIHSEPAFTYYQQGSGNRYWLHMIPADKAVVIEDPEGPYVEYITEDSERIPWYLGWPMSYMLREDTIRVEFHVPPGSVDPLINLDAKN